MKDDLSKVTEILRDFNVSGMSFDEVQGSVRMKRREIRERVGWTVRTVTPEYEARTRVVTAVPDTLAEEIIDDLVNNMGSQNEPRAVIIVKEVFNVYEIGTKLSGDTLLTHEHNITENSTFYQQMIYAMHSAARWTLIFPTSSILVIAIVNWSTVTFYASAVPTNLTCGSKYGMFYH